MLGVLAELDLAPASSGMEGPAAEPWVMMAAADSMVSTEGSADQLGDAELGRGARSQGRWALRGPPTMELVARMTSASGGMEELAARPWVMVAAAGPMMASEGGTDQLADGELG